MRIKAKDIIDEYKTKDPNNWTYDDLMQYHEDRKKREKKEKELAEEMKNLPLNMKRPPGYYGTPVDPNIQKESIISKQIRDQFDQLLQDWNKEKYIDEEEINSKKVVESKTYAGCSEDLINTLDKLFDDIGGKVLTYSLRNE